MTRRGEIIPEDVSSPTLELRMSFAVLVSERVWGPKPEESGDAQECPARLLGLALWAEIQTAELLFFLAF